MSKSKELELLKVRMASFETEYGALLNELIGIADALAGDNCGCDVAWSQSIKLELLLAKLGVDRTTA
jgi:hypothetical protein